tara:strand:- start:2289 stop:2714 length:426 start_codon:yes stop_codon:yes gene_type:complete
MAQELTATLALSSTAGATGTSNNMDIDLSVSDVLTVVAPLQGLSAVIATATPGDTTIKPAGTVVAYLYVKHTGTTDGSTATARQVDVEFTTGEAIARLSADEFLFMPVHHAEENVGVNLHVQHADPSDIVQLEYAWFTKGA